MKEKLKTVLLTLLVVASLMLSLGIWGITPQYEAIDSPQYASQTGIVDPTNQRTFANIAQPSAVYLHFGESKHAALFPGQSNNGYSDALALLHDASFFGITITTDYGEAEWKKLVNDGPCLQFDFDADMPASMLDQSELLKFNTRVESTMEVKSLYLFRTTEDNDLRALMFGGQDNRMYLAHVELPKERFTKLFAELKDSPDYSMFGQSLYKNFYLPTKRLTVAKYSIEALHSTNVDRLVDSFFVDKSLTRRVLERDRSLIVTDGSKLVRVGSYDSSLEFRNLAVDKSVGSVPDSDFALDKALTFVNDHGGFVGSTVLVHELTSVSQEGKAERRSYEYRQYVAGVPVIGDLATYDLSVTDTDVADFKRSQFVVGPKKQKQSDVQILSGAEFLKMLETSVSFTRSRVTDVYLAYLIGSPHEQVADLQPVYVVEQASEKRSGVFDAVTGDLLTMGEGSSRGLE